MKPVNEVTSSCRHCQSYQSEGRRGGHCQQLGVPVQGGWKACSLAVAPFAASWEKLAGINAWRSENSDPHSVTSEIALKAIVLAEAESVTATAINAANAANAASIATTSVTTAAMLEEVLLRVE